MTTPKIPISFFVHKKNLPQSTFSDLNSKKSDLVLIRRPNKNQSIHYSSPDLVNGSYQIYTGRASTGTEFEDLRTDGIYKGNNFFRTFSVLIFFHYGKSITILCRSQMLSLYLLKNRSHFPR